MKPSPKSVLSAKQFPGLITNADPGDIPFGAGVIQDNLQSIIPGRLTVRKGWKRADGFNRADIGTVAREDLTNIYRYRHPGGDRIITVTNDGDIQSRSNDTVTVLKSGEYGAVHWTFARDRGGALLGINGFGRGLYWDGVSATAEYLGLDPPTVAPTVAFSGTGGPNTEGDYHCYYRYIAGPPGREHYSNLSPVFILTAGPGDLASAFAWSGLQASSQPRVHTIELLRTLPGNENTLYRAGVIIMKIGSLTFSDDGGGFMRVTSTRIHSFQVNDSVTITGSTGDDGTYTVTNVVDSYTFDTDHVWSTSPAGSSAQALGAGSLDDSGDQDLLDAAIADSSTATHLVSNGELIANRFVPPPEWKMAMAKFQDRMFYAVDALVTAGSVTTTADSTTVVINGVPVDADWDLEGRVLYVQGENEPMTIQSVLSATQLYVDPPPASSQLQVSYVIRPSGSERNAIYYSEPDEEQSVPRTNIITIQDQAEDEDEIVGIHSFGPYLYVLKEHHIFTVSYIRQPRIDAQARLLLHRGAFNHFCWDTYEGVAYLMDSSGCYVMGMNGSFESISDPIQDLWRDGTIDITDTYWFFVRVDTKYSVARFFVRFTGDLGTKCRRALCYNIRTGAWWTESYPMEVGGATSIDEAGDRFNLGAGQNDIVVDMARGEADMIDNEVRGTVVSATAELIGDTGANFTDVYIGATCAILDENGRGQVRTIVRIVTPTLIEVSPLGSPLINFEQPILDPIPDVGSTYLIGGIHYQYKSGQYDFVEDADFNRRALQIEYTPTAKQYDVWVRRYYDEQSIPENNWSYQDLGEGVVAIPNTPEIWVSIYSDQSVYAKRNGRSRVSFSGQTELPSLAHWAISVELEGIKGDEAIHFNGFNLEGATD